MNALGIKVLALFVGAVGPTQHPRTLDSLPLPDLSCSIMRASELEAWALEIIDRVKSKQPVEDSRVELKSKWPRPEKATRQLAGHCNAARGESVLWLVGIDEEVGVVGADRSELANWLPSVVKTFESVHPDLIQDTNIAIDDKTVVALLFSTERAPYVVLNPRYGETNAGPVKYEVPWREGTRVRSARHTDLIRLLVPIHRAPSVEVTSCTLKFESSNRPTPVGYLYLRMNLYIVCHNMARVIVPFHRCEARIEIGTSSFSATDLLLGQFDALSETVRSTPHDLMVDGAGFALLSATISLTNPMSKWYDEATFYLSMRTADADFPTVVAGKLVLKTDGQWELPDHAT